MNYINLPKGRLIRFFNIGTIAKINEKFEKKVFIKMLRKAIIYFDLITWYIFKGKIVQDAKS
jgi:hypothetical protein